MVKEGLKVTKLIQVCSDISDFNTVEREKRALLKAAQYLKCEDLYILSENYQDKEEDFSWYGKKKRIKFIPLDKWLLTSK